MKKIVFFIFLIVFAVAYYGCQKIYHTNELPLVNTGDTSNIKATSVTITGTVTTNDAPIQTSGHVWSSVNQLPTYSASEGRTTSKGLLPDNKIVSTLNSLSSGKTYFIRGYVISAADTVYGNVITFFTGAFSQAAVSTGAVSNIRLTSADVAAVVTSTGNTPVTQHGIVWSKTNQNPTTADSISSLGALTAPGSYTSSLSNLSPGTIYYARAYLINSTGTNYGNVVSFSTLSNAAPSVSTDSVINISINSATAKGNITNIGSSPVTQYGHVWSSINNLPTINDSKTQLGTANAATNFISQLTSLSSGTTYYVRSYAVNNDGISYGQLLSFTTSSQANSLPQVTTGNISAISFSTANAAGNITDIGSSPVTHYGHVWSNTNSIPTIADSKTDLAGTSAVVAFNSSLTGLQPDTYYWIRAYAINSTGISYGKTVIFNTSKNDPPVVDLGVPPTNVTYSTATFTGYIRNIGSSTVTQYGLVWSSSNNLPTTGDNKTQLGISSAPLSYSSTITGLTPSTFYYVRSYAINSAGVSYSGVYAMQTAAYYPPPTIVTRSVSNISFTSATAAGTISSTNNSSITEYGHVWSSTNNIPTTNDNKTQLGSSASSLDYNSSLTSLSPGTAYYVRAYAINFGGISYGDVVTFTTPVYTSAIVTTGDPYLQRAFVVFPGTILSTGNTPVTEHGHVWSNTNKIPTLADSLNKLGSAIAGDYNTVLPSNAITGNVTYIRAYVTNSAGTTYGDVKQFFY